jgi:hypothetical protein
MRKMSVTVHIECDDCEAKGTYTEATAHDAYGAAFAAGWAMGPVRDYCWNCKGRHK